MKKYTYSVVIPHHNVPELLQRCLDSIPARDDIQVIVVDDNSDPQKVDFAMFPGRHREGVDIVLTGGGGAGCARNVGLRKATGRWILFADADDYYSVGAFDILDKYTDSTVDYHCFKVTFLNRLTGVIGRVKNHLDTSGRIYFSKKNERALNTFKYKNFVCWNKMYSSAFLKENDIHFEESRVCNDVYFSLQVGYKSRSFNLIDKELYCYTHNANSITYSQRSVEREYLFYLQAKKRNGFYDALGLGRGFKRYDGTYMPYMICKRGIREAMAFYRYCYRHRKELAAAKREYLSILNNDH